MERPVVRDRLSKESTRARSLLRSSGSTKCASVARCSFWGRNGRSPGDFPYTMIAPPGVRGRVAPGPPFSSASQETTAIPGRSPLNTLPTSPTAAASETSCPNPTNVCARPSSSAPSAPMRITFATREFPSASQVLNGFQIYPADLDHLRPRGVSGNDAHIAPRNSKCFGKKLDQSVVRHSLNRRCCYTHLQRSALQSDDLVVGCTGLE